MRGSSQKDPARIWPSWPILRPFKRLFADESAIRPGWDATTEAANVDVPQDHLCVLVVDDNPVNLLLASEMFSSWGIKPMLAADGAQAVSLASELRFDLILMDIQMPVLDGLAATREIRRVERELARARVPIVAYTSSRSTQARLLRDFGLDAVLDKPCDAQALRDCLVRWCPSKVGAWCDPQDRDSARH